MPTDEEMEAEVNRELAKDDPKPLEDDDDGDDNPKSGDPDLEGME